MPFSFRKHIILSRLYNLRDELEIAATTQKEAEEEKKKPKKAKKPQSAKAKKIKRGIIISLYVAGIVLFLAMLAYTLVFFYIEQEAFYYNWRENKFLFFLYDWLTEENPAPDCTYIVKEKYLKGFAVYVIMSMYLGTIGTIALIYLLRVYVRGKAEDDMPLALNGMRWDVKKALDNSYGDILDSRDWDKLDKIIYLLETHRADTVKEALQLIDRERNRQY